MLIKQSLDSFEKSKHFLQRQGTIYLKTGANTSKLTILCPLGTTSIPRVLLNLYPFLKQATPAEQKEVINCLSCFSEGFKTDTASLNFLCSLIHKQITISASVKRKSSRNTNNDGSLTKKIPNVYTAQTTQALINALNELLEEVYRLL